MPKSTSSTESTATDPAATPRLGDQVFVRPLPGRLVINNEVGGFFAEDAATPQTVTVTLLRRLADGDLMIA